MAGVEAEVGVVAVVEVVVEVVVVVALALVVAVVFRELVVFEELVAAEFVVFVEFEVFEDRFHLLLAGLDTVLQEYLHLVFLPRVILRLAVDIDHLRLAVDIGHRQEIHLLQGIHPTVFELEYPIGFVFVPILAELDGPIVLVQELSIACWLELPIVLGLLGGIPTVQQFV